MSEQKHTPEPWNVLHDKEYDTWWVVDNTPVDGDNIAQVEYDKIAPGPDRETMIANARRIVQCVNGCAGIPDPETIVPELVYALEKLMDGTKWDSVWGQLDLGQQLARAVLAKLEE